MRYRVVKSRDEQKFDRDESISGMGLAVLTGA